MRLLPCFILLTLCACQAGQNDAVIPQAPSVEKLGGLAGRIVFQSNRDGDWEIFTMTPAGTDVRQLTKNAWQDEYPVWSPDGRTIAFKSNQQGNYDIYIMDHEGSNVRRLTHHAADDEDPAWTADGSNIAFHSKRDRGLEIYIVDVQNGLCKQLTDTRGRNILPAFSPDGRYMAYTGSRFLGWTVYRYSLAGGKHEKLTDLDACRPDWSPDGGLIAFVSGDKSPKADIWVMTPEGKAARKLISDPASYDYYPAWSPDGSHMAWAKAADKKKGNWEICVMQLATGQWKNISQHPAQDKFPDWAFPPAP